MKNKRKYVLFFLCIVFCAGPAVFLWAQDEGVIPVIKFRDADIKVVLQSIAEKAVKDGKKVNILTSPNVEAFVTVSLENVDWQMALDAVLKTYEYGYMWVGSNIILVDSVIKINERQTQERERQEVEVPTLKVFNLKYLDANDASKAIAPLLSPLGRVSVFEGTGQAGWEFGSDVTKRSRANEGKVSRTKVLVVSDVSKKLEEIVLFLKEIDIMPMQILIKAKIMEVNRDFLEDLGFDWGTGDAGASSGTLSFLEIVDSTNGIQEQAAGHMLTSQITPSIFGAKEASLTTSNTGLKMAFQKLTGSEFEAILHLLSEDARTNTLASPTILTLNNQEASILVGEKFPIVNTEVSTESNQIIGGSLDRYEDIGVQLNVVPQICGENNDFINMIVHPAITSSTSNVSVTDQEGNVLVQYPKINSREAETQVIVKDGETIVIGGLLKEVKGKQTVGVPFFKDIPLLGRLFRRDTYDLEKVDLLIFITARVVKPGEIVAQEIVDTEKFLSQFETKEEKKDKRKIRKEKTKQEKLEGKRLIREDIEKEITEKHRLAEEKVEKKNVRVAETQAKKEKMRQDKIAAKQEKREERVRSRADREVRQ